VVWQLDPVNEINTMSNTNNTTTNAHLTAIWDDEAGITFGAYVVKSTGWWSEDGDRWYCGDDDSDFDHTTITLVGGPADGKIVNEQI